MQKNKIAQINETLQRAAKNLADYVAYASCCELVILIA